MGKYVCDPGFVNPPPSFSVSRSYLSVPRGGSKVATGPVCTEAQPKRWMGRDRCDDRIVLRNLFPLPP